MIEKSEIISLIDSEIEKNLNYERILVMNYHNNRMDPECIADMNFMNGFMSALAAVKDKINFM